MSVDYNEIFMEGQVKVKGKLLGLWKLKWLVLRLPSSRGPARLDKFRNLEAAESQAETNNSFIALNSVTEVTQSLVTTSKHIIEICFRDQASFLFSVDSENEAASWKAAISYVIEKVVDKVQQGVFHAYLLPTQNLLTHGECVIRVIDHELRVFDAVHWHTLLVKWSLCTIRRYGRQSSKFTIESGSSSDTGPGIFVFNTYEGEKIYEAVHRSSEDIARAFRIASMSQPTTPQTTLLPSQVLHRGASLENRGPLPPIPGR